MKNPGNFLLFLIVLPLLFTVYKKASAQNTKPSEIDTTVLLLEQYKSHQQVPLTLGMFVNYRTTDSKKFKNAKITGFTDSTISFGVKEDVNVTLRHDDIGVLEIYKEMYIARSWVGQTVTYKNLESNRFEEGTVTQVTDNTISLKV
jgi:hypothetical protein